MLKTEYTGTFNDGCPGNAGIVKCRCEIYANKPIFKRRQQDQDFVVSDETIKLLPEEVSEKMRAVPSLDGVYLAEIFNYRHNYLAFLKKRGVHRTANEEDVFFSTDKRCENVLPLQDLDFLTVTLRLSLFGPTFEDGRPTEIAESPHQTWIVDGSLFCRDTQHPSEYSTARLLPNGEVDLVRNFSRLYLSAWRYDLFNKPPTVSVVDGSLQYGPSSGVRPYQFVNAKESPATALQRPDMSGVIDSFKKGELFHDINPGIHWSAVKRTPVFQGEDFWVEFTCGTPEPNIPDHGKAIFKMQSKYKFLDVQTAPSQNGVIINGGVVELDEDGVISEKSKELYDFSRQSYFMIETGVYDPDHNYFIIIPEKDYPIFIHAGIVNTILPKQDDGPAVSEFDDDTNKDCPDDNFEVTEVRPQVGRTVVLTDERISRRLSSWTGAKGKKLMEQEGGLRVTVRNHLGSIVVTFSGFEDNPWVINRADLIYQGTQTTSGVLTEDDFQTERVPMIVSAGKIAIHGGNRQSSFTFSPLQYHFSVSPFKIPQPMSILGPVEQADVNLLFRDKGITNNPSVSSIAHEYEFSMDSQVFIEIVEGKPKKTFAIDVQPDAIRLFGKAPDAQIARDSRRIESTVRIDNGGCLTRVGSSGPYVKSTQVWMEMFAGDYIFPNCDNPDSASEGEWRLDSCITPILTHYRLYVPPTGTAYEASAVDVAHHVLNFSDSWTARDFNLIEHTGRIQFLVNDGMEFEDQINYAPFLSSLIDKTFYIQVSVWWENGVMPLPVLNQDRVMITGLCTGGSMTTEDNKKVMTCEIFDYYRILKDQMFLNSPFFDKMRDFNAVYDILKMAGFRDIEDFEPASLMKRLAESEESGWFEIIHNGDVIVVNDYALPGSYDVITQPFMRFNDGEKFAEAIERMATLSGKVAYFDRLGVFHFENLPFEQLFFNGEGVDYLTPVEDYQAMSKIDFFVSPGEANTTDFHRQVFNSYTTKRNVEDVVNEIRVISTTPNGELLVAGHTNFDSLFRHDTPGFIGYPKQFLQMDGVFGSEDGVKYIVKHYTKMFTPPVTLTFEAMGHNKIKALDVVTFQGLHSRDKQPLIVNSVSSEIDPSKNTWTQSFECQWIFPSINIDWGPSSNETPTP